METWVACRKARRFWRSEWGREGRKTKGRLFDLEVHINKDFMNERDLFYGGRLAEDEKRDVATRFSAVVKKAKRKTAKRMERETARVERETAERVEREIERKMARKMKAAGETPSLITEYTGLTEEEIADL